MRIIFFIIFVFLLGFVLFIYLLPKQPTAIIDGHQFLIDVAKTPEQQEVGLSKYNTLPKEKAMFFPFAKPGQYTFWMKGMHFPIDIVFLRDKKIITIVNSAPAPIANQANLPTYNATSPIDSVLEINAGLSKKYGFKVGDKVNFSL